MGNVINIMNKVLVNQMNNLENIPQNSMGPFAFFGVKIISHMDDFYSIIKLKFILRKISD